MRRRPGALRALTVLAAVVTCGCLGYHLSGSGSTIIPEHVKSIAVSPFENRTDRPEIEQRVTEAVARELSKRGKYSVVTDRARADAILDGAITRYTTIPVQFSSEGRTTRREAVGAIQATLRDSSNDEVLWSQRGLIFREQFDVPAEGEFFDEETLALDDIAAKAAGTLVTSILEGGF